MTLALHLFFYACGVLAICAIGCALRNAWHEFFDLYDERDMDQ